MLEQFKRFASSLFDERAVDESTDHFASLFLKFSYADLFLATQGFSSKNMLGSGCAGQVYRGCLRGGTEIAVKVLADPFTMNSFHDELSVLGRFRHPNLVTLLGWGQEDDGGHGAKFLVYELLSGGDVGRRLFRCKKGHEEFPWQHRICVALDAACGLSYMINSEPKAFHRDIKPTNILLDACGNAKMADFGLAGTTRGVGENCLNVEEISGTPGYLCPEFMRTAEVTEQSEIFSLGIVFLELLINELPAKAGPHGQIIYPIWDAVRPDLPNAVERILTSIDPGARWPRPIVDELAQLSLRCVHERPAQRPSFSEIVNDLRRLCECAGLRQVRGTGPVFAAHPHPQALTQLQPQSMLPRQCEHTGQTQSALELEYVAHTQPALELEHVTQPQLAAQPHPSSPLAQIIVPEAPAAHLSSHLQTKVVRTLRVGLEAGGPTLGCRAATCAPLCKAPSEPPPDFQRASDLVLPPLGVATAAEPVGKVSQSMLERPSATMWIDDGEEDISKNCTKAARGGPGVHLYEL